MAPVVRSKARPEWERMRSESTFYYKCPNRRRGYVVSFAFIIDDPQEVRVCAVAKLYHWRDRGAHRRAGLAVGHSARLSGSQLATWWAHIGTDGRGWPV